MSTPFAVSKHHEADGVVVLTVAGDIDESTDDALLGMIENCVDATRLAELRHLLRDLVDPADINGVGIPPSRSPRQTPLWSLLERIVAAHHPGGTLVPTLLPAQTDARYLRPAGTVTYGFALLSASLTPDAYWSRFHGADERIDVDSLELMVTGYREICRGFMD